MRRRMILTGFAALAATPVLAQSAPATSDGSGASATPQAPAPAMKIAPALSASAVAEVHRKDTLVVGSLSLLLSRLAEPKAKHPMVKQFAGFEVAEQETIADVLKGLTMPGVAPTGIVMPPTDTELTGAIDTAGKASLEKLRAMKAGPDFDRAYVKAQVDGHHRLLQIQDAYLNRPASADETNIAKLARAMIKEHLALLATLEKMG